MHRRRIERRGALSAFNPGIHDIRPLLEHMAAPLLYSALLQTPREECPSSWAFLDPVAIKTQFVEKRRARPVQIMNGEGLQRQPLIA